MGVPLAVIAKWLGHADAATTARIYAHSQDDALRDASKSLGAGRFSNVRPRPEFRSAQVKRVLDGAPDRIRTCGLLLRRQTQSVRARPGSVTESPLTCTDTTVRVRVSAGECVRVAGELCQRCVNGGHRC